MRLDPVDIVGVVGVCLVAVGLWQLSPSASVIWMGAVLIAGWVIGTGARTTQ